MSRTLRIILALAIVLLFVASMAGDGIFTDAQVFALPWYGAAYHVLKTAIAGFWAGATLESAINGKAGEP